MVDLKLVRSFLQREFFVDAAYFGIICAIRNPSAEAHMLTGVGCCGCARKLANAQRLLEGVEVADEELDPEGQRIPPLSHLAYEGFFHLIQSIRLDRHIQAPDDLRLILDGCAEDLAFLSRREVEPGPSGKMRYSMRDASVAAAILLKRMTRSTTDLPGVPELTIRRASDIISTEVARTGGDAAFM